MFHTGLVIDGMALSSVLSDVSMNKVNDIRSDACAEYSRQNEASSSSLNCRLSCSLGGMIDMDELTMNHGQKY